MGLCETWFETWFEIRRERMSKIWLKIWLKIWWKKKEFPLTRGWPGGPDLWILEGAYP
jgi:hypothetical protein